MKPSKLIAGVLLLSSLLAAQAPPQQRRLFEIKHADVNAVANMLNVFSIPMRVDDRLRFIAVSANEDTLRAIEEMIKKLDVPPATPKNIELTAYILVGSPGGASGSLPAELHSVASQLAGVSAYKSLRLLDTVTLRARAQPEGARGLGARTVGVVNMPGFVAVDKPYQPTAMLETGPISLAQLDKGNMVRIGSLKFRLMVPNNTYDKEGRPNYNTTEIETSVDVKEGQKVVIGKSSMAGGPDHALILVLTAKVLD